MQDILINAGFVLLGMVIELTLSPLSRVFSKNSKK